MKDVKPYFQLELLSGVFIIINLDTGRAGFKPADNVGSGYVEV